MPSSLTDTATLKSELRRKFLLQRSLISENDAKNKSRALCAAVYKEIARIGPDTVLLFAPTRHEPDLLQLFYTLTARGIRVAFPISDVENTRLDFRYVNDLSQLTKGAYGIYEPSGCCERANAQSASTVCVVPALAVDSHGTRLGYGKGYYDRFLASFCGVSACAVFSDFLIGELPRGEDDVAVNRIITEGGVISPYEHQVYIQKDKDGQRIGRAADSYSAADCGRSGNVYTAPADKDS